MKTTIVIPTVLAAILFGGCATLPDHTAQQNKELVRRYFEEWVNRGDKSAANLLIATNVVVRNPPHFDDGLEAYTTRMAVFHQAFPDLRFTIQEQVAEGHTVAARWTFHGTQTREFQGRPATGAEATVTGISIFRIRDGKIREITVNMDRLGFLTQLGWLPPPAKSSQ